MIIKSYELQKIRNNKNKIYLFYGDNEGLIIAEVEMNSENEKVELPHWLATEVTGERKYYNSALTQQPYTTWKS